MMTYFMILSIFREIISFMVHRRFAYFNVDNIWLRIIELKWTETILLYGCGLIHSYIPCRMNIHADRGNLAPASCSRSERLTTFEIGLGRAVNSQRVPTMGNWIRHARVHGAIFAPKKKKKKKKWKKEKQRASVRKRQAENDQPYRQTVGRLILPGVHPPAIPSIRRLRGMRSIPSWVINNIWRLVFPRGARVGIVTVGGGRRRGWREGR